MQHRISEKGGYQRESDIVGAYDDLGFSIGLCLSLPSNDDFKSLLVSFSTQLTNKYLITRVIQYPSDTRLYGSSTITRYCNIAKPFVWHRNEGTGSVVRRAVIVRGTQGNQARVVSVGVKASQRV